MDNRAVLFLIEARRKMSDLGPSPLSGGETSLSVTRARAEIDAALRPIRETQNVPLTEALGRVLATDVVSPIDVPAHDNSAMDGYAFASSALRAEGPSVLTVVGTIFAGATFEGAVETGSCVRIMTGAVMPAGLGTIVAQ